MLPPGAARQPTARPTSNCWRAAGTWPGTKQLLAAVPTGPHLVGATADDALHQQLVRDIDEQEDVGPDALLLDRLRLLAAAKCRGMSGREEAMSTCTHGALSHGIWGSQWTSFSTAPACSPLQVSVKGWRRTSAQEGGRADARPECFSLASARSHLRCALCTGWAAAAHQPRDQCGRLLPCCDRVTRSERQAA